MGLTLVDVGIDHLHRPGLALHTLQSAHLDLHLRTWVVLEALLENSWKINKWDRVSDAG